jgi:hypothetical protein
MRGTSWVLTIVAAAVGVALGVSLLSGATKPRTPQSPQPATVVYSCCQGSDVDTPVHPGEQLNLHWVTTLGPPPGARVEPVVLTAKLTGASPDAASVKTGSRGRILVAQPIHTTNQAGGSPVSLIDIPSDALPGYYDLEWGVAEAGAGFSARTVIRVVAEP